MSGTNGIRFNIGRNGQAVLVGPYGKLELNYTEFRSAQKTHEVTSRPVNGRTQVADLPDMWTFEFDIDRDSSQLDDTVAQIEAAYFAGGTLPLSTLYDYVNELNGSESTYQFDGVTFTLNNAGTYKQDDAVKQTISGKASTRRKIS